MPTQSERQLPKSQKNAIYGSEVLSKAEFVYNEVRICRDYLQRAFDAIENLIDRTSGVVFGEAFNLESAPNKDFDAGDLLEGIEKLLNRYNRKTEALESRWKAIRSAIKDQEIEDRVSGQKRGSGRGNYLSGTMKNPEVGDKVRRGSEVYEFMGEEIMNGVPVPKWRVIEAQIPLGEPPDESEPPKHFTLKRAPR